MTDHEAELEKVCENLLERRSRMTEVSAGMLVNPDGREAARLLREMAAENERLRGALTDPDAVHINMLRGGIAKPTPTQIGHLYRGDQAAEVVAEVLRQNPEARALTKGKPHD